MNGSRQECSTVWPVRCGYGAVVDGQGGPRVAGSSGLDAVGRKTRLTPRADQLNRGDAPVPLTLASTERRVRRQGRGRDLEGRAVGRFCLPKCRRGRGRT